MEKRRLSAKNNYRNAMGTIAVTLRNDMMLHYTMQKSERALKGLICALKGLDPNTIKEVKLMNPIDYGSYSGKEIILDIKVIFNNNEIMDIELQVYHDAYWKQRSLLYLCRTYDSIGQGDKFNLLKPATFVAIMSEALFPEYPEFYSRFYLTNEKYNYPYTTNFSLNVLDLSHTDLATGEDRASGLLHWANMFLADTWEELTQAAGSDPTFEEVIDNMYTVNTIPEERTLFEAHQKYLNAMASVQAEREEAEAQLAQVNIELNDTVAELSNAQAELSNTQMELSNTQTELSNTQTELCNTQSELSNTRSELERIRRMCLANGLDPDTIF
ncbi:MAG: PD-(D/E)XK nuclease family transposase [Oribacterium sp.]|nr:PD-(D/E)XK nuclease family transposase [Oribacterium sp.]MBP3296282.1 PD-(D/E)XK nuclease family transposase [Lachnospiraceae bacterium]